MRTKITLVGLGLGLAATFAPLTPASAYCMDLSSVGGPSCINPCYAVLGAYDTADRAAKDALPGHTMNCLA